jgi:UDP-glucose 4-epimerase
MAVCLVTGGAGFIGSHLVDALVVRGHEVRVLDNLSTGAIDNLAWVRGQVDFVRGDVTEPEDVRKAVQGVEVVYHQAALASVPRSIADPMATHHACATGTLNVLIAARDAKVRRVVYAASSSAYGNSALLPRREAHPPSPRSPYAIAKLTGEHYCEAVCQIYGLETVRLRYFNVFGPRQPPGSPYSAVIPLFIEAMLNGRDPIVQGDGLQSRDFTYVEDVIQANLLAAEAPRVAGQVYNIACGRRTTLIQLLDALNDILGTSVKPLYQEPRAGDVRHSEADIARAQTDLGYCPRWDLKEGLARSVEYYAAFCKIPDHKNGHKALSSYGPTGPV